MLVNAYDNGASTGEIRRLFGILGPSDPRKKLATSLDPQVPDFRMLQASFGLRFGDEDEADSDHEEELLRAMAQDDRAVLDRYRKGRVFR